MKGKFFKALAVCLVMLFTATSAYASPGNKAANGKAKGHYISDKNKKNKEGGESRTQNQGNKFNKGRKGSQEEEPGDQDQDINQGRKFSGYVAVSGIVLNKTSVTLDVRSWERLTAAVQPANATDKKYFWFSSNPMVASVNPSGKITGLAPGTAIIYVATRDGFKTDSCSVTVDGALSAPTRVTGVVLSSSTMTLDTGHGRQLTAAITVRTVDGGKTAACAVTVRHGAVDIHVSSVSIIRTVSSLAIKEGAAKHLNIEILPENAGNKEVIWRTSNSDIVSVNQAGYITGVHEGTATVTVTTVDGSKNNTCTVRVIPADEWIGVTRVSLNLINSTIPIGFTDALRYEIEPYNASDQDVRWSSSNSAVAAVNSFGRIEAKAVGTAVISAITVDGGKTASCLVVVTPSSSPPSHGILLNKNASTLLKGEFDYPAVVFYPANEDDYDLTWTSNDTGVAAVDQNGRVTAKSQGTAVITVRTSNYWSASYVVMVVE